MKQNKTGMVLCPHPRAANVGVSILEAGGNAFDAAIATAFVQMIVGPFMCGIGGLVSAHLWARSSGKHQVIEGAVQIGSKAYPDMWSQDYKGGRVPFSGASILDGFRSEIGYSSICVPGTVAAFGEIHSQYATWPWADLLQPAIRIAREGAQASPYMREYFLRKPYPGAPPNIDRIRASEACARIYLHPDGSLFDEGEVICNPDYANTLEILAVRGWEEFYRGELAQTITEDLVKNGSWITRQDLEQYHPQVYTPSATTYREYKVFSGGPLLLEALNILECFDLTRLDHNGPEHIFLLADTLRLVLEDQPRFFGDPENMEKVLLDKKRAEQLAKSHHTISATHRTGGSSADTTHLVVVDGQRNIASITHTIGYGSGVVTPGLGFIYNNLMARLDPIPGHPNPIAPGKFVGIKRLMPTIVFQDGEPRLILGAQGGNAILSACLQTMSNVLDFNMTPVEAVSAPRIHAEGTTVWAEARIHAYTCDALMRKGYNVEHELSSYLPKLGQVQVAQMLSDGRLKGGSDPRGGGGVVMEVMAH